MREIFPMALHLSKLWGATGSPIRRAEELGLMKLLHCSPLELVITRMRNMKSLKQYSSDG
jgi:hypothetical protein